VTKDAQTEDGRTAQHTNRARAVVTVDTGAPPDGSNGPDYLLIHGIGVSSRYFERIIPLLARRARVVAVDLPGFGRAPKPGRALGVDDFAECVAAVVDELGLSGCVVFGHSMGTQVATRLAIDRPEAVAALALMGPVMDPRDRSPFRAAALLALDCAGERPRANWLVLSDYARCGLRWYLAVLPSMLTYRIEDDIPLVDCPVLVLRGERDPIARAGWVSVLAASARRGGAKTIDGARHLAMHTRPEATDGLLALLAGSVR